MADQSSADQTNAKQAAPETTELVALMQRLQADHDRTIRGAWTRVVLLAVLIVIVMIYMPFLYVQIGRLDANAITDIARYRINEYLSSPESREQMVQHARDAAPSIIGAIRTQVEAAPHQVRIQAQERLEEQLEASRVEINDRIDEALNENLWPRLDAMASQLDEQPGATDTERIENGLDVLRQIYAQAVEDQMMTAYVSYVGVLERIAVQLDTLAANEDLSERDQLTRRLVQVVLALQTGEDLDNLRRQLAETMRGLPVSVSATTEPDQDALQESDSVID